MRRTLRSPWPLVVGVLLLALMLSACSGGDPTATSTEDPGDTVTATATRTPTGTPTETGTPTPDDTGEPTDTATEGPTETETSGPVYYIVQDGDTLFDIAVKFDVPIEDLMEANNIDDPTLLQIGQELYIPLDGNLTPPTRTPTEPPTPTPTPPPPADVNGIPVEEILQLNDEVTDHIREIWARGQENGADPRAFSVVGDSTVELPHFLSWFDGDEYDLGPYAYLQDVIDQFKGSFEHDNVSVHVGLHSWSMFDPFWADAAECGPNEGPVACEIRVHRPSIVLIRLGSNDAGIPDSFEENMRKVVQYAINQGVVPVLGTKGDRAEGSDINNEIIRRIASDLKVPLWDWDRVAATLPNRGIDPDDPNGVHLVFYPESDFTRPEAFERGHGVHNLTALIALDRTWRAAGQ